MTQSDELQQTWQNLVAFEEEQFLAVCELDRTDANKSDIKSEALRMWWKVAAAMLRMHARSIEMHGIYLEPAPVVLQWRLSNISEDLSTGNVPKFVSDTAKGGAATLAKGATWDSLCDHVR